VLEVAGKMQERKVINRRGDPCNVSSWCVSVPAANVATVLGPGKSFNTHSNVGGGTGNLVERRDTLGVLEELGVEGGGGLEKVLASVV
jgi:hypothetical protein